MEKTISKTGIVVELNGGYFGEDRADGHSTSYDFIEIERAKIFNPKFYNHPEEVLSDWDKTRRQELYERLKQAVFKKIEITTTFKVS